MTIEASVQQPTPAENEPFDLVWTGGAEPPERLIDFGPDGAGGYPVVEVAEASDEAALHLAYAASRCSARTATSSAPRARAISALK